MPEESTVEARWLTADRPDGVRGLASGAAPSGVQATVSHSVAHVAPSHGLECLNWFMCPALRQGLEDGSSGTDCA